MFALSLQVRPPLCRQKNMNNTISTPAFFEHEHDFLKIDFSPNLHVDSNAAKRILTLARFCKDQESLWLMVDISHIKSIDKAAREFFSKKEILGQTKAMALIANSTMHKIIGNIFITFEKPSIPCMIFSKKSDALVWLQELKSRT